MKKGFTLVELIMVVAIIAIVSMLAVSKIGNLRDASARKVSVANQQAIGRAVEVWLNARGQGRINRLDSLLTYEQAKGASSGSGFDYGRTNETNRASSWLYRGWDSIVEAERMQNEGLTPELCAVLVPYGLNAHEAASFTRHLGLNFVMHHLATPGSVHEGEKRKNAAGTEIPEFAGVLDPCGQTIRQARLSAK